MMHVNQNLNSAGDQELLFSTNKSEQSGFTQHQFNQINAMHSSQSQQVISSLAHSDTTALSPLDTNNKNEGLVNLDNKNQQLPLWSTQRYPSSSQNLIKEMNDCLKRLDNMDESLLFQLNQLPNNLTQSDDVGDQYQHCEGDEFDNENGDEIQGSNVVKILKYDGLDQKQQTSKKLKDKISIINGQAGSKSVQNLTQSRPNEINLSAFKRVVKDEISLSSFPLGSNGDLLVSNSLSLSQLQHSTPQLFNDELRNIEAAQSSPNINIEEISQQIKAALFAGSSPTHDKKGTHGDVKFNLDKVKTEEGGSSKNQREGMPSQFSTNYKSKNPYKSRQISIHTNAFLATDAGDNSSNNQEIFSTARTTSQTGGQTLQVTNHKREVSNTKSFFTQTINNTFISYDNITSDHLLQIQAAPQNPSLINLSQQHSNINLKSSQLTSSNHTSNNQLFIASDQNFNLFSSYQHPPQSIRDAPLPIADLASIKSQIFQTLNGDVKMHRGEDLRDYKNNPQQAKPHTMKNTRLNTLTQNTPQQQSQRIKDISVIIKGEEICQEKEDELFLEQYKQALKVYQEQIESESHAHKKRLITYEEEIKLRPNLKRKIKQVVSEPSEVPMTIYYRIISFDGRLFKKFVQLSKGMRKHLVFHVFESTNLIAKEFNRKYGQLLYVESRFITFSPLSFNRQEGSRLELTLRVKVKQEAKKIADKSIIISNGYSLEKSYDQSLTESRVNGDYQQVYHFDLFKSHSQRYSWIHKDECLFHGNADARAYSMPIMPICVEDKFEISVTLLSLMGALDMNSVKWQSLKALPLPNQDDVRDYNRFKNLTPNRDMSRQYFADLKRVCEVEDAIVEWFTLPNIRTHSLRSHIRRTFDTSQFQDQFEVLNVEVGGIDFSVWKVQLKALQKPSIEYKFYTDLNMGIKNIGDKGQVGFIQGLFGQRKGSSNRANQTFYCQGICKCVLPQRCCQNELNNQSSDQQVDEGVICNEVKRSGFLIDRGADIQVRGGDTLMVYLSMGGFEK